MRTKSFFLFALVASAMILNLSGCKDDEEGLTLEEKKELFNRSFQDTWITYKSNGFYIINFDSEEEMPYKKLESIDFDKVDISWTKGESFEYNPNNVDFYSGPSLDNLSKIERLSTVYVYPLKPTYIIAIPYFYENDQKVYGDTIKKVIRGEASVGLEISDGIGGDGEVANTIYFKPYIEVEDDGLQRKKYYNNWFEDASITFSLNSGRYFSDKIVIPITQKSYYFKDPAGQFPDDVAYTIDATVTYNIADKTYENTTKTQPVIRLYDKNKYAETKDGKLYETININGTKWIKRALSNNETAHLGRNADMVNGYHVATEDDINQLVEFLNIDKCDTAIYITSTEDYYLFQKESYKLLTNKKPNYTELANYFDMTYEYDITMRYYYCRLRLEETENHIPVLFFLNASFGSAMIYETHEYEKENYWGYDYRLFVEDKK